MPVRAVTYCPAWAPAKMPSVRMRSKSCVHVERVLPDEHALEGPLDEGRRPHRGVGRLALPDQALVGVDADVDLVAVRQHLRRAHVRDLQLRTAVGRGRVLDRAGQAGQAQHAARGPETGEE